MIYLIKSAAFKEEEGKINTFFLLKIGYTEDNIKNKRFLQYKLHNPTCQVLFEIPGGTEDHEKKVQYKFKNLLYENYGKEWFKYSEKIIDFFKSIKSLKDIDILPYPMNSRIRYGLAKNIVSVTINIDNILEKSKKVDRFTKTMISILGKDIMTEEKVIEYLKNNEEINQDSLEKYLLRRSESEIVYSLDSYINQEAARFIERYDSYTTRFDKLRFLCECGYSNDIIDVVLKQISDSDEIKSYYLALGPQKLRALSYDITRIRKALGIVIFSQELLRDSIYSDFKEGMKLPLTNIKYRLELLYSSINYSATPKATDICNYFEVKECLIPVEIEGKKKRVRGYELLKSKEQQLREESKLCQ